MVSRSRIELWWVHALMTSFELADDRGFDIRPYMNIIKRKDDIYREMNQSTNSDGVSTPYYNEYIDNISLGIPRVYYFRHRNDHQRKLAIIFDPGSFTVNISTLNGTFEAIRSNDSSFDPKSLEMVYVSDMATIKHLVLYRSWPRLRVFTYRELVINPTRHTWHDEHQVIDPNSDTYRELLKKVGNTERGLVKSLEGIYYSDIISRYYGFREGQIIRIVNRNSIMHNSIVHERIKYRVVLLNEFK